jgi:enamine deaminase RidA (YjgF/YER057c/UK114 family)
MIRKEFPMDDAPTHASDKQRVYTGAPWEKQIGYCRALRTGNLIFVTGTAPVDEHGGVFAPGDGYRQAQRCCEIITRALGQLGAGPADVVRTRMFVTDIRRWAEFGRAHQEVFGAHPPCTTMVEVKSLIDPAMLIEVEADAVAA